MEVHLPKLVILTLIPIFLPLSSSSKTYTSLTQGSSLSSPHDVLVSSPMGIFTAGFYAVGDNAYCFSIWFTHAREANGNQTVVWMANRDQPVSGKHTKLSLLHSGSLILRDAGQLTVWTSGTASAAEVVVLKLHDNGDLVLRNEKNTSRVIWRSFDSPTHTLLPEQALTAKAELVSSRSLTNQSSGFYKLYFDNDNVLRLMYSGFEMTSVFWPVPWKNSWEAGRSTYNSSKTAVLDLYGRFSSTDDFKFNTSDLGVGPRRRMKLDVDGIVRVYSLNARRNTWEVTWQLPMQPCNIHGICGANSLCNYSPASGRRCSCLPRYKPKDSSDWSQGCVPDFDQTPCKNNASDDVFSRINHAEFYGYDIGFFQNQTLEQCKNRCLSYCECKGFQYKFDPDRGFYNCYPKTLLFNGYQSSGFEYWIYLRLPPASDETKLVQLQLQCTNPVVEIQRPYTRKNKHGWLRSLAWCVGALGALELVCVLLFLYKTRASGKKLREQGYFQVATGFTRFTYAELKKASRNFSEEIGRGGSGVVYKGVLSDNRVAAIKRLNEANQGEAEFLAEVSLIGRLNHANLIERWGYCAEGKHRLLVYEYLGNGCLTENLRSKKLDWRKKFEIAVGVAKGLAYLHEECLEWVLHCDVKPHNILLDENYQPKVADFGLSKQLKRSEVENLNVSTIRGTRGYMAPEWVYNLPITAKVDVYSYGIVVLEMVTGKIPNFDSDQNGGILERDEGGSSSVSNWIDQIVELGEYDVAGLENLIKVALQCAQENRNARPTMAQVVDMLLAH
ncbi:putative receptor protein kinase ZmPK1 [Salvia miltiorrhiza]|uniref:putative receptor protein kinase ZmPK1 n=1 Tax=Salvia miltiorrhiza TaxID=226208 RepID=UPI0025AC6929|nr:putative receptor protein kinase ZmPK1 [Salvia miltiorrhiza]